MELISVLRVLLRHRVLAAAGALAGVLAALFIAYQVTLFPPALKAREQAVSTTAAARVLIDAPEEPTIDLDSLVADTLPLRAQLLADLLASDGLHTQMARDAGLPKDAFAVLGPSAGGPPLPVSAAVRAADAARTPRTPYVLAMFADGRIPIITIRATGFDPAGERRLVAAAAKSLEDVAASRRALAPSLSVRQLGPISVRPLPTKSRTPLAVGAGLGIFALWCGAIVVLAALARARPRRRRHGPPRLARVEGTGAAGR